MQQTREAFPAGLYGVLLLAVFGLTLPSLFAPVERLLVGAAALVPRLVGEFSGTPAAAAEPAVLARLATLQQDLGQRVRRHDVHGAAARMGAGWVPDVCAVVSTERRGGGGQPSALRLGRTYEELAGCGDLVTKGNALLGFLQRPGKGLAVDDAPSDRALVVLLNDRSSRSVTAALGLEGGGSLRMIVGPAARVDVAPLRAELWDNPYRASRMGREDRGRPVYTLSLPGQAGEPPGGLLLGRTVIWGYPGRDGGEELVIGVFVAPPVDPAALSHVVLWRADAAGVAAGPEVTGFGAAGAEQPATVRDLPGDAGRYLLAAAVAVPDGAAVVQDGLFLGTTHGLAFGMALVTSFPVSRQRWSLLLLPDEPGARPRELEGVVVRGGVGVAEVRFAADRFADEAIGRGCLFTGSNGPHCPAGLFIGRASPIVGRDDRLEVQLPVQEGPRAASVIVREELR